MTETICDDGTDNDGDGRADCLDGNGTGDCLNKACGSVKTVTFYATADSFVSGTRAVNFGTLTYLFVDNGTPDTWEPYPTYIKFDGMSTLAGKYIVSANMDVVQQTSYDCCLNSHLDVYQVTGGIGPKLVSMEQMILHILPRLKPP